MKRMRITGRSRSAKLPTAAAVLALFVVLGGVAWAVKSGETKSPRVRDAITLTFPADGTSHELFSIGDSTLSASCGPVDTATNTMVRKIGVTAGSQGAVIGNEEGFEEVAANDSEVLLLDEPPASGIDFAQVTFAVFDGGGQAASGTAAVLTDPANNRCRVTAQAAG